MSKSSLSDKILWMALGLVGTLALAALIVLGIVVLTSQRQPSVTPTPVVQGPPTITPINIELPTANPTVPTDTPLPPTLTPTPPGPVIHIVKQGETLLGIATEYGVTVEDIQRANGMQLTDVLIRTGQELVIPVKPPLAPPTPAPTETRANPGDQTHGARYACPANATERQLTLPWDPIRLVLSAGQAYFVADGDLYAVALTELAGAGPLAPSNVIPPDRKIDKYYIRELVHAAADPNTGDLILLDKSDDIYRRTTAGEWRMQVVAAPIPNQYPDPQYLAVQAYGDNIYALDADLSRIWKFTPGATLPIAYYVGADVSAGMDLLIPSTGPGNGAVYVLTRQGRIVKFIGGVRDGSFAPPADLNITWPGQIFASDKYAVVVDSNGRRVIGLDAASGKLEWQLTFRFPNMQRLRSAAIAGDTLYAVAGRKLYIARLSAAGNDCPPVQYDDIVYFGDLDLGMLASTLHFKLPFPGATLPSRPRSYPGARRLYRFGIHEGVDLYSGDVAGLGIGSPVSVIADGIVIRADTDYVEMTPQEYDALIARTEQEHRTPPDLFDKLLGRQVRVSHIYGVESRYAHLSAIEPAIVQDAPITQGSIVGQVGVSGTSAGAYGTEEGAHLHFEIWVNGRYLGQGLSLYETMRLWQEIFR